MGGESSRLSLVEAGSSTQASLGGVAGLSAHWVHSGAGPLALVAVQPAGSAGAATPSKFSENVVVDACAGEPADPAATGGVWSPVVLRVNQTSARSNAPSAIRRERFVFIAIPPGVGRVTPGPHNRRGARRRGRSHSCRAPPPLLRTRRATPARCRSGPTPP